jgi:hypothetical protein
MSGVFSLEILNRLADRFVSHPTVEKTNIIPPLFLSKDSYIAKYKGFLVVEVEKK